MLSERLVFVGLLGIAAVALADGPGSGILTNPEQPRPAASSAYDQDRQRCEEMSGAQKDRCQRALRSATSGTVRAPHEGPSPARPGGSNAGNGASSGTSGASSAVGGAR